MVQGGLPRSGPRAASAQMGPAIGRSVHVMRLPRTHTLAERKHADGAVITPDRCVRDEAGVTMCEPLTVESAQRAGVRALSDENRKCCNGTLRRPVLTVVRRKSSTIEGTR